MYKEAYQLMKRADSSWWDNVKSSVKKGWKDFNDYADKNDWVRPVTYGATGTAALSGLGALMGGKRGAIIGASIGAPTSVATGFIHNNARKKDREDTVKKDKENTDGTQEQTSSFDYATTPQDMTAVQMAAQEAARPKQDVEQATYNVLANKQPAKSVTQKVKDKIIAGKEAVKGKLEERKQRKAQQRAAQQASGQPKKPNIIQRTVNKTKEKMTDIKANREAKKKQKEANPQAAKPGIIQSTVNKTKETAGKVKTAVNDKLQQRRAAKEQAAFQALNTPQEGIAASQPDTPKTSIQDKAKALIQRYAPSVIPAATPAEASIQMPRSSGDLVKDTIAGIPGLTPAQQARLQFVLPRYRNKAIDMINARYPNASQQEKLRMLIDAMQNQAKLQLSTARMY